MKIVNNTILNTSLVGVYVNKGDYNYIANNEIQARVNAYALWFWYDDGDGSTYNTVSNNKLRGGRYAYPIRIGPGCNYNRILNNLLYVQDAPGIIQDDGTGTVLSNNLTELIQEGFQIQDKDSRYKIGFQIQDKVHLECGFGFILFSYN